MNLSGDKLNLQKSVLEQLDNYNPYLLVKYLKDIYIYIFACSNENYDILNHFMTHIVG